MQKQNTSSLSLSLTHTHTHTNKRERERETYIERWKNMRRDSKMSERVRKREREGG
jgi:hypothetical protein